MGGSGASARRVLTFGAALTLHLALLGVYLATRPAPPLRSEPRTVEVWLAPPSRPPPPELEPDERRDARDKSRAAMAAPPPPRTIAASPSVEDPPPIDPEWRVAEPSVAERLANARPLLRKCLDGTTDDALREECEKMWAKGRGRGGQEGPPPRLVAGSQGKEDDFARTMRKREAFRTYRQTGDLRDYPGLRCAFGRACELKGRRPPP